jgi:hypothetical protein
MEYYQEKFRQQGKYNISFFSFFQSWLSLNFKENARNIYNTVQKHN